MKKIVALVFSGFLSLSLFGCQKNRNEEPSVMIQKAWEKQIEKQQEYSEGSIGFKGNVNIDYKKNLIKLKGNGNVQFDTAQDQNMKAAVVLNLDASGTVDEKSQDVSLDAEFRAVNHKGYLFFKDVSFVTDDPNLNLTANFLANLYKGQWFELPFDIFDKTAVRFSYPDKEKNEKIIALAKKNNFFEAYRDLGNRRVEVKINPEKLKSYIKAVGEIQGSEVSESYLSSLDSLFKLTDYTLEVEINNDYDVTFFRLSLNTENMLSTDTLAALIDWKSKGQKSHWEGHLAMSGSVKSDISFDVTTDWTTKKPNIEAPKESRPFELGGLFGGLLNPGGQPLEPTNE